MIDRNDLQRHADAVSRAGIKMGLAVQPAARRAVSAWNGLSRTLRGCLWRAYHSDGCPFGETREGLERWTLKRRALLAALGGDRP